MVITELLNDFAEAKRSQVDLSKLLFARRHHLYSRFHDCGSFLHLREWLEHDGKTTVHRANFCMCHKLCRICAIRRAAKTCEAYERKVNAIMEDPANANLIPVMVTFTIKNRYDLIDALNHLTLSYRALWERSRKERKRNFKSPYCCVLGSVYAIEIKRGKGSGLWHPHMHAFCLCESIPNGSRLRKEWQRITGDSTEVEVSVCKKGIRKALIECLKYITKFSEAKPIDVLHIHEVTRSKRLIAPSGILRGVKVPESLEDEELSGAYVDYLASFLYRYGRYKLKLVDDVDLVMSEKRTEIEERNKREDEIYRNKNL